MATSQTPKKSRSLLKRLRDAPARFIGRTAWLRRRYARRLLRTIEKFKKKGRQLPENLARLDRQLRQVPPHRRQELVEKMMEMSSTGDDPTSNRALRRASSRQERQKGQRGGGLRPGTMPGQPRQRPRN
ncbi:MAG: hypothetical protein ACRDWE_06200 [Acidimicrobiales bacterium]